MLYSAKSIKSNDQVAHEIANQINKYFDIFLVSGINNQNWKLRAWNKEDAIKLVHIFFTVASVTYLQHCNLYISKWKEAGLIS